MKKNVSVYVEISKFLSQSLGKCFEVILFEYKRNNMKPVYINNVSDIVVKKVADYICEYLDSNQIDDIHNYTLPIDISSLRKLYVHFIVNEQSKVEGALCITKDIMPFLKLSGFVSDFIGDEVEEIKEYPVTLSGIDEYLNDNYDESNANKKDMITEAVIDLYDLGMFTIKGSVAYVAEKLNISVKSLYRYIAMIKEHR